MKRSFEHPGVDNPHVKRLASAARMARPKGVESAGVVLQVVVVALLVGSVLTGDRLGASARGMEYGPLRTAAVIAAAPAEWLNRVLSLDRARLSLREVSQAALEGVDPPPRPSLVPTEPATPVPDPDQGGETPIPSDGEPAFRNSTPTIERPLKLDVMGDSMTEAFGKYLKADLINTGVVDAAHDFAYSSGIARPDFFDWPGHLEQRLAERDPDVIVMMIGANDGQDLTIDGKYTAFGSSVWEETYRARVARMMDAAAVGGRRVYWVGLPIARSATYSEKMRTLNRVFSEEADKREAVEYVDTWNLFAGSSGEYTAYYTDSSGTTQLVRRDDGIHLNVAGAHVLTWHMMAILRSDYELPASQ